MLSRILQAISRTFSGQQLPARPRRRLFCVEPLEDRTLLTTIVIDYSLDTNNFFDTGSPDGVASRAAIEAAAVYFSTNLTDDLDAIIAPGDGQNTWTPRVTHPGTGQTVSLTEDMVVPQGQVIVYAGGRNISSLGQGGPGGRSWTASGDIAGMAWIDLLYSRGEGGGTRDDVDNPTPSQETANEFAPWGGAVTFDNNGPNWHFDHTTLPSAGEADFYSVALHELAHVLGFGTADSFDNLLFGAVGDEIGVWRGGVYFRDLSGNSAWNSAADEEVTFGLATDTPIIGDWNNDGFDEIGVWRDGLFYLDANGNGAWDGPATDVRVAFGAASDIPIIGNWDGMGGDDIGVFRPSNATHYQDVGNNGTVDAMYGFGASTDLPIAGDWNGDGVDQIGVYRPSTSSFYRDPNGDGSFTVGVDGVNAFGAANDAPIIGDWDNDGVDEIGVFRSTTSQFYRDFDGNGAWDGVSTDTLFIFGAVGDTPIVGDWRGDAFTGATARAEYDAAPGNNIPLDPANAHWLNGLTEGGNEVAMDPSLLAGTRKLISALDLTALDDLGWDLL